LKNKGDGIVIYHQKRRSPNKVFLAFLGILVFIAIYVPFFGSNLQYQTGTIFKYIFNTIGTLFLVLGGISLAINILKVFANKKISIGGFTISILLLWIGAFLTGTSFTIMGYLIGGDRPPIGYH
jgi:peptidoglycan/LPS O-acetylase OafA/YrhL